MPPALQTDQETTKPPPGVVAAFRGQKPSTDVAEIDGRYWMYAGHGVYKRLDCADNPPKSWHANTPWSNGLRMFWLFLVQVLIPLAFIGGVLYALAQGA